jgi:hypothetical protein
MNSSNRKVFTGSTPPHKRNIVLDDDAEMRYDASQLAMAIQEPLSDDPVGPGGATREERWDEPMETGYSPEPPLMDDDDIPF